jgi:hypothetical protein
MEYVHLNPVRAGYVESPEDYRWSSARFLLAGSGSPNAGLPYSNVMESLGTWREARGRQGDEACRGIKMVDAGA